MKCPCLQLKSLGLQLADAEAAVSAFTREINTKKNTLLLLENRLDDLKNRQFEDSTNRTIQIVLNRGLIEIPLTGRMSDFENCILIHRSDVAEINVIIKKAGMKKILAMENAAQFRRKIISQEWEHKVLKLRIRDVRDQIKVIEKCKITKEVQLFLKRKEMGWEEDLGKMALDREIENIINSQEKMLNDVIKAVEDLETKIRFKRKENKFLDKTIKDLNVNVAERNLDRDFELEEHEQKEGERRMKMIVERARLVRVVQLQHAQILELTTMLELQRLRTYPTLTAPPIISAQVKNL